MKCEKPLPDAHYIGPPSKDPLGQLIPNGCMRNNSARNRKKWMQRISPTDICVVGSTYST